MGKDLAAIVILFVVTVAGSPARKNQQCSLMEAMSAFDRPFDHRDNLKRELAFMVEFARFVDQKVPDVLRDFSAWKKSGAPMPVEQPDTGAIKQINIDGLTVPSMFLCPLRHSCRLNENDQVESCEVQRDYQGQPCPVVLGVKYHCEIQSEEVDCFATYDSLDIEYFYFRIMDADTHETIAKCRVTNEFNCGEGDTCIEIAECHSGPAPTTGTTETTPKRTTPKRTTPKRTTPKPTTWAPPPVKPNLIDAIVDHIVGNIDDVGTAIEGSLPIPLWDAVCPALWFPLQSYHCYSTRCAACAPAITTASSACRKAGRVATTECVETVLGIGFCNSCARDYVPK